MTTAPAAPPPSASDRGFSLIEVLVAIALTALVSLGVASLFSHSLRMGRMSTDTTQQTVLARERLELLVAVPSTSTKLNPGTIVENLPGNFKRTTYIVSNQPAPGSKTIKVRVQRGTSIRDVVLVAIRTD